MIACRHLASRRGGEKDTVPRRLAFTSLSSPLPGGGGYTDIGQSRPPYLEYCREQLYLETTALYS